MRQFKTIMLMGLAVIVLVGQAHAAKRYEIKSGYIKYENTHGTDELYWDNYGEQEARYTDSTVSMFGMTQTTRNVSVIDGKWAYNYDQGSKTASKVDHEEMMGRMMGDKAKQPRDFSDKMLEAFDAEKVGTDKVLGRKTTIYNLKSFGDYQVWIYKGVPLKAEMKMMGFDYSMQAVEFKENIRIEQAKLRLPKGMEIVDTDVAEMPTAEEMQQARDIRQQMQNDPEMQEAMRQMQEMRNSPEMKEAMQQMQDYKNSPEYQDAMKQAAEAQKAGVTRGNATNEQENIVEDVGDIIKDETSTAVKSTIRDTTRDVIGGGLKSLFGN